MEIKAIDFKTLPSKAIKGVNELGAGTIQLAKNAKDTFTKYTPRLVKKHKETFVGGAVILLALSSAAKITSSIKSKIKEIKNS